MRAATAWIDGEDVHGQIALPQDYKQRTIVRSSGFSVVLVQCATQPFPARDFSGRSAHFFPRCDQLVLHPLMVALRIKMVQKTARGRLHRSLPESARGGRLLTLTSDYTLPFRFA